MTSEYLQLQSVDSPSKRDVGVSKRIEPNQERFRQIEGANIFILDADWLQELQRSEEFMNRVQKSKEFKKEVQNSEKFRKSREFMKETQTLFQSIESNPSRSVTVSVHLDALGVSGGEKQNYAKSMVPTVQKVLNMFPKLNKEWDLKEIRVKEHDQKVKASLIHLKEFRLSLIGWESLDLQELLRAVSTLILTQEVTLNMEGTRLSADVLFHLKIMIRNNLGLYQSIDLNLRNCWGAGTQTFSSLIEAHAAHPPKVLKLSFAGWGKDLQSYFLNHLQKGSEQEIMHHEKESLKFIMFKKYTTLKKTRGGFQNQSIEEVLEYENSEDYKMIRGLITNTHREIEKLRKSFFGGNLQTTLDFREWDQEFDLKSIQERNNMERENLQSFGMFSMTNSNTARHSLTFLA